MTELVVPMVLICVILNIAISIFWGSGLLLSDTNIDSVLALPIPLRTLITLQIDCPVYGRSRSYCGAAASYDGAVWPNRRYGISVFI